MISLRTLTLMGILGLVLGSPALLLSGCATMAHELVERPTPLPVASDAECRAAGYPLHVWHDDTELLCPPDPLDPTGGHSSDFPTDDLRRPTRNGGLSHAD